MTIREGRWLCPSCRGREPRARRGLRGLRRGAAPRRALLPARRRAGGRGGRAPARRALGRGLALLALRGANPNSLDGQRVERCRHCGEARDETDADTPVRAFGAGEAPATAQAAREAERTERQEAAGERRAARPSGDEMGRRALAAPRSLRGALLAALALLALAIFALWAWPRAHEGRVAEMAWTRTIDVERLVTHVEGGWEVPAGGRPVSQERRVRSYRDVVDHYETRTRQVSTQVADGSESYACGSTDPRQRLLRGPHLLAHHLPDRVPHRELPGAGLSPGARPRHLAHLGGGPLGGGAHAEGRGGRHPPGLAGHAARRARAGGRAGPRRSWPCSRTRADGPPSPSRRRVGRARRGRRGCAGARPLSGVRLLLDP
jgi:hypothetical protein